jgi:branched-chain amino acid transport system permease protein
MGLNLAQALQGGTMNPPGEPRNLLARRANGWAIAVAAIIVALQLIALPVLLRDDPYWLSVATNANILSVGGLGLWLMFSIGRIDIAQGAFAAIGGYTTAILSTRYGISFWVCLPLSALSAALVATVIGWPILRLKGVYFAMITLSLTEVTRLAALNGGALTNGADGLVAIPQAALLDGPMQFYLLSAVLMLLAALLVWRIAGSRIGSIFRSMRQNEDLASSLGINITHYRIIAFAVASGMGGVCGSFLAESQQNIFPGTYTIADSIDFMLYCFLGGLDFVLGPIVGTYLLVFAFEFLDALQRYQALLYGILMIAVMLFLPNGLLSLRRRRGGATP